MNFSTADFPVHYQLPEPTQTHVHCVGDAIQSSHPLLSPSPPAFNLSQHQGLFKWVGSSHQVARYWSFSFSASVLPVNIQDWFPLGWTGWISLQSKGLSRVFSNTSHSSIHTYTCALGFSCGPAGKESACNVGDLDLLPGLGRSPGEGKGYPLQ